ncbi:MAG: 4'-phosphopantetheinyl transferase superfamily protein [Ruminococcaceae bacterium]|nr:4'-phosphopantetheinyl transferase superfamily protein [Oscillospiraceae bacterium]
MMLYLRHQTVDGPHISRAEARAHGSAVAHALLQKLLLELKLPSALKKAPSGKPMLAYCDTVDFNLSHTEGLAVCALLQSENAPRVGVDAELLTNFDAERISAFSTRFFAPYEQKRLAAAHDPAACFTRIFTRKEAYAKYCGNGLGEHLSATDTLAPDFESTHGVRFHAYRHENVFIMLCVPENVTVKPTTTLCEDTATW